MKTGERLQGSSGQCFFFFFYSLRLVTLRPGVYCFKIFTFMSDSGILFSVVASKVRTGVRYKTAFSEMTCMTKIFKHRSRLMLSVNDSEVKPSYFNFSSP